MKINDFNVIITDNFSHSSSLFNSVILLFVLDGNVSLNIMEKSYDLKQEDFIVINKNRICEFDRNKEYLLAVIKIDYHMLCSITGKTNVTFRCNSAKEKGIKYDKFRYIIGEFLNEYAVDYENITFSKLSNFYKLCNYMVQYFTITDRPDSMRKSDSKLDDVLLYLEKNYNRKVSLEEISKYVYMAPTSFSRFFHKAMGMTYVSYINQLRLNYAEDALLYSTQSITEIALNAGFSNISAFNRLFKKVYGVSPGQFKNRKEEDVFKKKQELEKVFEQSLEKYKNRTRLTVVREQKIRDIRICAATKDRELYEKPWKGMIHLGLAAGLLSAEYQKHIRILKEELNIEYGCLTGIFSSELKMRKKHETKELNFSYLDNVLDCLINNKIHPVITFDNQVTDIVKDSQVVGPLEHEESFETYEECIEVISQMIRHFIYRYGIEEVDSWMFDLWYNESKGTTLNLSMDYCIIWDGVYKCIRSWLPNAKIGGSGTGPSLGYHRQLEFYEKWAQAYNKPDFVSINGFPYREQENCDNVEILRRKVDNFLAEDLSELKKVLKDSNFPEVPIYVLQWNLSFVQRNYFNDTSAKAAIMLRNLTRETEGVDWIAYWVASDLQAGDFDSTRMLNGACGLLSKDGVRKPAFYAVQFINRMLDYVIGRGDNYMITTDGRGHIAALLFNSKEMNYNYYSKSEAKITLEVVDNIFLDEDVIEITLLLKNVENGLHFIHKQIVSPEHGDILNEWRHLGIEAPLTMNDVYYLKQRCVPYRKNEKVKVNNHEIELMERLKAHEIMLLEINFMPE